MKHGTSRFSHCPNRSLDETISSRCICSWEVVSDSVGLQEFYGLFFIFSSVVGSDDTRIIQFGDMFPIQEKLSEELVRLCFFPEEIDKHQARVVILDEYKVVGSRYTWYFEWTTNISMNETLWGWFTVAITLRKWQTMSLPMGAWLTHDLIMNEILPVDSLDDFLNVIWPKW